MAAQVAELTEFIHLIGVLPDAYETKTDRSAAGRQAG